MTPQEYLAEHKERFLEELFELLRIQSISADSSYKADVIRTAHSVADSLKKAGADQVEINETPGYPVVTAEKIVDPAKPTVLVYGHYDVQPPDPMDLWESGPFEPVIKKTELHPEGAIFARGACDDKGQMFMHIKAFEAMWATDSLACNIKFMIEGEEEVGSENLAWFVERNKEKMACDVILISDTGMLANDIPSICTGLRGLSYVEVELTGPNRDLHSGLYGGAVANPINVLNQMIASLHNEKKEITIPGFYDKVEVLGLEEREEMAKAPFSQEEYNKALDIAQEEGKKATDMERNSIRPTLDVNGIWGGYTGEGAKTVIPSKAYAKISMRWSTSEPEEITQMFTDHSVHRTEFGAKVTPHHGGEPYVSPTDTAEYQAASKAMETTFGKRPIPVRSGGSIPIVPSSKELNAKSILFGFGLDSDAIHSPNEHYGLFNFFKGLRRFLCELFKIKVIV